MHQLAAQIKINPTREKILEDEGHMLIEGGPGSGKTTIALLKAKELIDKGKVKRNQKILFLSFARATVSRVEEQAAHIVTKEHKRSIEINTYHSFSWQIIRSFGYLITKFRSFKLISPPNFSAKSNNLDDSEKEALKRTLLKDEGTVCFDLFCDLASEILGKSDRICALLSNTYPYIIVDEFQDTDAHEWKMIQMLGKHSEILALADLGQRIYEFRGASITRIPEFNNHFKALTYDLGKDNNRSANTDIAQFGDDLLTGANQGKTYQQVKIYTYGFSKEQKISLKSALSQSITRLKKAKPQGWSIAVLVKTKQDTLNVSTYLSTETRLPQYFHEVLIDPSGPALAAHLIATILEHSTIEEEIFISDIINHIRGRNNKVTQADLKICEGLEKYLATGKTAGSKRKLLVDEIKNIIEARNTLPLVGIPEADWLAIRKLFNTCTHSALMDIAEDATYIKLMKKGATLREQLSETWRSNSYYHKATQLVDTALTQEHFSMATRKWEGIFVMTIHKSKGKEFDEVIIWDEPYRPIVPLNATPARLQQDRLLLRVAVTRARSMTTFLTPAASPCVLL